MLKYITAYAATAVTFLALDVIWIGLVARGFYFEQLRPLLLEQFNIAAAAGFYIVYVVGVVFFAVAPALRQESVWMAVGYGALFGFFTYATYDMTNYATLKDWPLTVVVVDIAWGTLLAAVAAGAGYYVTRMFHPG